MFYAKLYIMQLSDNLKKFNKAQIDVSKMWMEKCEGDSLGAK